MTVTTLSISVIIPTHNRRASLRRLLDRLAEGTLPPDRFEVIVVADGCNDGTLDSLAGIPFPFDLRSVALDPARGPATARNEGARIASAPVLLFVDDDIEPSRRFLEIHLAAHETTGSAPAGGRSVLIGAPLPVDQPHARFHDAAIVGWWHKQFERMERPGHRFRYDEVFGGILSLPRDLFFEVGQFDEAFNGCREDPELGLRLIRVNARIAFSRDAGGHHHEVRNPSQMVARKQAEGRADVLLAERFPEIRPALSVSHFGEGPASLRGLRRLALSGRHIGSLVVAASRLGLGLLERLRFRGFWRALHGATMHFSYWRGASAYLGEGRQAAARLQELGYAAPPISVPPSSGEVELAHGLAAAGARLDEARPASAAVCLGGIDVGIIPDLPGGERLAGRHLRASLRAFLAPQLQSALALQQLADPAPSASLDSPASGPVMRHAAHPGGPGDLNGCPAPVGVADVDLALGPRFLRGPAGCGLVRVLIRHAGRPLGWITIGSPPNPDPTGDGDGFPISERRLLAEAVRQLGPALINAALLDDLRGEAPPTGQPPAISIVVCTRDRPDSLRRCLESLRDLDYPSLEVIVVDNASATGATAEVAAGFDCRCVREERPGLDWARNRGVAEARHQIIAFTDDDVRVDRLWLRGLATAFAEPDVMLVTGLVLPAELATDAQVMFESCYGGMSKGFAPRRFDPATLGRNRILGAHHLGVGANMAFRRAVFEEVGPFDTALDVGTPSHGGGDLDMFHRVLAAGRPARYQPSAVVWHYHRREMAGLRRQLRDNGRAFGVYLLTQAFPSGRAARGVSRRDVMSYAAGVWFSWLLGRVIRGLMRRERLSLPLQAREIVGALEAPWAFLATRRADRRIRGGTSRDTPRSPTAA